MPVRSIKTIPGKIWIPPSELASFKITVERKDGTIDDISRKINSAEIVDAVTDSIGRFKFEIWDPNETYKNTWNGNEIFRYYSDYSNPATTLRFRGEIEKPSHQNMKLSVTGRSVALNFMNITVTKSYDNIEGSLILKDLIDNYGNGLFTYTNVESSLVSLTKNWHQKPFWNCVKEICKDLGYECYVDANLDFHLFESGSKPNPQEAIVRGYNMTNLGDFADDNTQIRNRVIVYGAKQDGIQEIYTAEDTSSQTKLNRVMESIINDQNIVDEIQAQETGDYNLMDAPKVGEVTGILLATIQPGQSIYISSQRESIEPKLYPIVSYTHHISNRGLFTTVRISKEPKKMVHILSNLNDNIQRQRDTSINPYEMRYTYNFLFDSDSGFHNNTEIIDGVLKLRSGENSGYWISPLKTASSNITSSYLILIGQTLTGVSVEVSNDFGVNYTTISNKSMITFSITDKNLQIKVTISDVNSQIDSLSIQYK